MNIIMIGCGRLGSTLANELSDEGHNITVIDRDNDRLSVLGSGFNGVKIRGIEYDDEVLQEAGIATADTLLAMTPDENINITVALIAKKIFKVPRIIARIVNPNRQYIYEQLDIETINLTQLGADIIKAKLSANRSGVITAINKDYEVAEFVVTKDGNFRIKDLEDKFGCIVSAIIRDENFIFPEKDKDVKRGERIICTISRDNLEKLTAAL